MESKFLKETQKYIKEQKHTPDIFIQRRGEKHAGYYVTRKGHAWHRLVYLNVYGEIPDKWHVHHIDGDKLNNDPNNLIAVPEKMHSFIHTFDVLPDRAKIQVMLKNIDDVSQLKRNRRIVNRIEEQRRKKKKKVSGSDLNKLVRKMKDRSQKIGKVESRYSTKRTKPKTESKIDDIEKFIKENPDKYKKV